MNRKPFPLAWPEGWARTSAAERSKPKFSTGLAYARDSLLLEIRRLNGDNPVITSDLPVRIDGLPYADGRGRGSDPGVAVYWLQAVKGRFVERVMACDRWDSHGGNMRAIALSIEALRGLDRWGGSSIVERAFQSFAALPPASAGMAAGDWRIIFPGCSTFDDVKLSFRRQAGVDHPDCGGSEAAMARLNAAYAAAKAHFLASVAIGLGP